MECSFQKWLITSSINLDCITFLSYVFISTDSKSMLHSQFYYWLAKNLQVHTITDYNVYA